MRILFLLAASCLFHCCPAQLTKDSLTAMMARETCSEINKKELSGKEDITEAMGMALMPVILKYEKELKELYALNSFTDAAAMENIGREVGMKLVFLCPEFARMIASNPGLVSGDAEPKREEAAPAFQTLSGTLLKIESGEFTCLHIKTPSGKMEKIWWFEYFKGADKLLENPAELLGKKVQVSYTERERFNNSSREYGRIKIAAGISPGQ